MKLHQDLKQKLDDRKCIKCNNRSVHNFKRQLCRECYNHQYIEKRRKERGFVKCACGCNEDIPALTATLSIAKYKYGHILRHTEENAKIKNTRDDNEVNGTYFFI